MHRVAGWREAGLRPSGLALAIGCAVVGQQEVWLPLAGFGQRSGPRPVEAATLLLTSVALSWCRTHPLVVVAVVSSALSLFELVWSSPDGLGPLLPLAISLYFAGRYAGPAGFALAAALTAAAVAVHEARDPGFVLDGQAAMAWGVIAAAGMVGQALALADVRLAAARRDAADSRRESEHERRRAVTAERARIARDLHDLVGHGLSLLVLQVTALVAERQGAASPAEQERLATLDSVARSTLAEMRRLVSTTDPAEEAALLAPQPRLADLPALAEDVRRCGFPVVVDMPEDLGDVPAGVEVALFRVAQEALTNVIRHAPSGAGVSVVVQRCDPWVVVRVGNEGSEAAGSVREGRGITGMRERVTLYGGRLSVEPHQDGRFVVEAAVAVAAP